MAINHASYLRFRTYPTAQGWRVQVNYLPCSEPQKTKSQADLIRLQLETIPDQARVQYLAKHGIIV